MNKTQFIAHLSMDGLRKWEYTEYLSKIVKAVYELREVKKRKTALYWVTKLALFLETFSIIIKKFLSVA